MRIKFIVIFLLLNFSGKFLFAQDSTDQKEKVVLKPVPYDSLKSIEEQFNKENQYQFIGLQLFLPEIITPDAGPIIFSRNDYDTLKGNKYFTIIDVLQGDVTEQLKKRNAVNICGYRYKNLDSLQLHDLIIFEVFVLKENNENDSLNSDSLFWVVCWGKRAPFSCSDFNSFVSVPYFMKQKQIFQNNYVEYLKDKSIWLCTDVALFKSWDDYSKDSIYDVFCILENDKNDHMQLRPPSEKYGRSFITKKEYDWLDHADRNEKEEFFQAAKDKKEKYLMECISKFGQEKGELIAAGNVKIGMTTDMCKTAWGAPWNISKKITSTGTSETWFYNWKYELHFENGILIQIKN